jgi:protein-tyrosine phosphatase
VALVARDPYGLSVVDIDRHIPFDAVFNFRDLGGYPAADGRTVRWRRLFRADGLNRLHAEEVERFAELEVETVVDLRTLDEAESGGRFPTGVREVAYHHLPMFDVIPDWPADDGDAASYLAARYVEMFTSGRRAVAATFALLGEEGSYPLVFHCAAGKDRTGIMAALVLELLGVADDVIAADYALSHEAMDRLVEWARQRPGVFGRPRQPVPSAAVEARPETMALFLRRIREETGGMDQLLADLDLDRALPGRIRDLLLETS